MVDNNIPTSENGIEIDLDDFNFTCCDSFSPDFNSSSASLLWYKAGQTAIA